MTANGHKVEMKKIYNRKQQFVFYFNVLLYEMV